MGDLLTVCGFCDHLDRNQRIAEPHRTKGRRASRQPVTLLRDLVQIGFTGLQLGKLRDDGIPFGQVFGKQPVKDFGAEAGAQISDMIRFVLGPGRSSGAGDHR